MTGKFLIKGFVMGFIIGVPVGPIGALTIQKILASGPVYGLISGIGSSTADLMYGCIAAFGLTFVSDFLTKYQTLFRVLGGSLILLVGIKIFMSKPKKYSTSVNASSLIKTFASTFALSATNPTTVFSFLVIFAGYGITGGSSYINALELVTGVFLGAGFWWVILTAIVSLFRKKINDATLGKLNKIFGTMIMIFGLGIFISLLKLI